MSKALVKKTEKALMWGSITSQDNVSVLATKVAQVYGIPPMGVTILGNLPYLNKDGRLMLYEELAKQPLEIETEWIQYSKNTEESAICRKFLVKDGKRILDAIGEASRASVKLEMVKNTLNMMAETRALNRVIWLAIAAKVFDRVKTNLSLMNVTEEEAKAVTEAGRVSAEEITETPKKEATKKLAEPELFVAVKKMIDNPDHTKGTLLDLMTRVAHDKRFTADHRKELENLISVKLDVIDNKK